MNFYNISFLKSQAGLTNYLWYIFIFGSLILLTIVFGLYLRQRIKTKYRDLSLIFLLFLVLSLGIQYSNYQVNQSKHSQSSQMVAFIEEFANNQNVDQKDVLVNSTQLTDGIIVRANNHFYSIGLNPNQQSYTITETHLLNNKINIISK